VDVPVIDLKNCERQVAEQALFGDLPMGAFADRIASVRQGLLQQGFVEGQNVVITTCSTPSRLGRSNMVSNRMLSMIERKPRAPVLRSVASRATIGRLLDVARHGMLAP
jgi:hypothetical protein